MVHAETFMVASVVTVISTYYTAVKGEVRGTVRALLLHKALTCTLDLVILRAHVQTSIWLVVLQIIKITSMSTWGPVITNGETKNFHTNSPGLKNTNKPLDDILTVLEHWRILYWIKVIWHGVDKLQENSGFSKYSQNCPPFAERKKKPVDKGSV